MHLATTVTDQNPTRPRPRWQAAGHVLAVALAQAPENAAYGLIALAPLGLAFGGAAMALALGSVVLANAVACVLGGGHLVAGPKVGISLLVAAFLQALLSQPVAPSLPQLLLLLGVAQVSAALLLVVFGWLQLGAIVKYTPHPVRLGVVSGVGLLLLGSATPVMLGHHFGLGWSGWLLPPVLGASLVGLVALGTTWWAQGRHGAVPAALAGLLAASAVHLALMLAWGAPTGAGAGVGLPVWPGPWLAQVPATLGTLPQLLHPAVLGLIGSFAVTVAVITTLDTLLAMSVVDGRLRLPRDPNRELAVQGLANLAACLLGGLFTAPSVPRSLDFLASTAPSRWGVLGYAAAVGALLLLAPVLLGWLPASSLGGVLVLQGLQMVAPSIWRTPWALWHDRRAGPSDRLDADQRHLLVSNWTVLVVVAASTALLGLAVAVPIGAAISVVLFVRSNMRGLVRRVRLGDQHRSLKRRTPVAELLLRREGARIAVVDLEGALFFGTAGALRAALDRLSPQRDTAVLDLRQVSDIDATGLRTLLEAGEDWARAGKVLVCTEWTPQDPRRRAVEAMVANERTPGLVFMADTDEALEAAEDRLLAACGVLPEPDAILTLADTLIGQGLGPAELQQLRQHMAQLQLAQGEWLFRAGDPGDALYVSLRGDIGLRLPGTGRRLASFAPGVNVGEMSVLDGQRRSADAIAETDLVLLRLAAVDFHRLLAEHPALGARVTQNIALYLAGRLRVVTTELSGWMSRAQAGSGLGVEPDDPDWDGLRQP